MVLPLPNLDDRTYADLFAQARAAIIAADPDWTDHNATDPGITLIELFAWLTEMLLYRANQVPDEHLTTFLKLLNGPQWTPGGDLATDIRDTIVALRSRDRAVTGEDYEQLALAATTGIARTRCVPRRYLDAASDVERIADRPGHVSVILVPGQGGQPETAMRDAVIEVLEQRRVLTTRLHVTGPVYAPVSAEVLVARHADVPADDVRDRVVTALRTFLDPLTGGPDGTGWPFGRDVYVAELYQLLEGVTGVDHLPDIALSGTCPPSEPRCVVAPQVWTDDGDLVGLDLADHHLARPSIDPAGVVCSAVFVAAAVTVTLQPAPDQATVRQVKATVRHLLHPLHGGPDGSAQRDVTAGAIAAAVSEALPGPPGTGSRQVAVRIDCDAAHAIPAADTAAARGVRVQPGELIDARVAVLAGDVGKGSA